MNEGMGLICGTDDQIMLSEGSGMPFKSMQSPPKTTQDLSTGACTSLKNGATESTGFPTKDCSEIVLNTERVWGNELKIGVQVSVSALQRSLQEFQAGASREQKEVLEKHEQQLRQVLSETKALHDAKEERKASRPRWRAKFRSGLDKFCATALHYQNIFDVLNEQAPEYTSAIWGAVKILLVASVNNEKLRQEVVKAIEDIGWQFEQMELFVTLQPIKSVVETVTATYKTFIIFLDDALKHYKENPPWKVLKAIVNPWETRFLPIVKDIHINVKRVRQLVSTAHAVTGSRTLASCRNIEEGQLELHRGLSMLNKGAVVIQEKQDTIYSCIIQQLEKLKDMPQIHDFLASVEAAKPLVEIEEKEEDILTYYMKPDNRLLAFRDEVFPTLFRMDGLDEKQMYFCPSRQNLQHSRAAHLHQSEEVQTWMSCLESKTLWIDSFAEIGCLNWATEFCLTLEDAATTFEQTTTMSFYCQMHTSSPELMTPETILQSFIFKVITTRSEDFTWRACRGYRLTRIRFEAARNSLPMLCEILQDCLHVARLSSLYLMIDNIDSLWSVASRRSEDVEKFEELIKSIEKLAERDDVLCKILITSRQPDALRYLKGLSTPSHLTKHTFAVPRSAVTRPPKFAPSFKAGRVPIRRKTVPKIIPDLEDVLANLDRNDDDEENEANYEEDDKELVTESRPIDSDADDDDDDNFLCDESDFDKYLNGTWASEDEDEKFSMPSYHARRTHEDSDAEDEESDYDPLFDHPTTSVAVVNKDITTAPKDSSSTAKDDTDECSDGLDLSK